MNFPRAFWQRLPLKSRLIASGLVLLSLLWSLVLWDMSTHIDRELRDARFQLETVARIGAQDMRATLRSADLVLHDLREHWVDEPGRFAEKVRDRQTRLDFGLGFQVAVIGPDGLLLYSSANPRGVKLDLSDRPHFKVHAQGKNRVDHLYISQPVWGRVVQRWAIQLTRPIFDRQGKFAGVLVFSATPDYLNGTFQSLNVSHGGELTVVRSDGAVVLHALERGDALEATHSVPPKDPRLLADALKRLVPTKLPDDDADFGVVRGRALSSNEPGSFAWRKVPGYPLTFFVSRPDIALKPMLDDYRSRYVSGGVITSLLLILVLYWVGVTSRTRGRAEQQLAAHLTRLSNSQRELSESQQALRDLSSHQNAVKEAERKRIAAEIHDELGQRLTVLRMDVGMLLRSAQKLQCSPVATEVQALRGSIDAILAIVRDIAGKLRPAALDVSLVAAAEEIVDEFQASLDIPCRLRNRLPPGLRLDETRATNIFRILQESLTNAARHARARRIHVTLALRRGQWLQLRVQDNGQGFGSPRPQGAPGFGLSGMRERAVALGGRLRVTSGPQGTIVSALIPLHHELPSANYVSPTHNPLENVQSVISNKNVEPIPGLRAVKALQSRQAGGIRSGPEG